jgi:hypothetical protein
MSQTPHEYIYERMVVPVELTSRVLCSYARSLGLYHAILLSITLSQPLTFTLYTYIFAASAARGKIIIIKK